MTAFPLARDQRKALWERSNSVQKINCRKVLTRVPSFKKYAHPWDRDRDNDRDRDIEREDRRVTRKHGISWEATRVVPRERRDTNKLWRKRDAEEGKNRRKVKKKKTKRWTTKKKRTETEDRERRYETEKRSPFCAICPIVGANFPWYTKALDILKHGGHEARDCRVLAPSTPFSLRSPFFPLFSLFEHTCSLAYSFSSFILSFSFPCLSISLYTRGTWRRRVYENRQTRTNISSVAHVPGGSRYFMSLVTREHCHAPAPQPSGSASTTECQASNETRRQKQRPEGETTARMPFYEYVWKFKRLCDLHVSPRWGDLPLEIDAQPHHRHQRLRCVSETAIDRYPDAEGETRILVFYGRWELFKIQQMEFFERYFLKCMYIRDWHE